jgi:hypothetical protein
VRRTHGIGELEVPLELATNFASGGKHALLRKRRRAELNEA